MQFTENKIFQNFSKFLASHQQLIYYIRSIFICQELFQNFFSKFSKHSFQNSNFSDRCLFRNSLFSISNSKPFVKNFFHSFQIFSVRPPRLSATALIEYHRDSPPVNNFFHFSAFFFFARLITNAATERPTLTADRAHATTSSATLEFLFFLRGFFIIFSPFIQKARRLRGGSSPRFKQRISRTKKYNRLFCIFRFNQ